MVKLLEPLIIQDGRMLGQSQLYGNRGSYLNINLMTYERMSFSRRLVPIGAQCRRLHVRLMGLLIEVLIRYPVRIFEMDT